MHLKVLAALVSAALVAAACGSASTPTAPTPTLSLSQTTVSLARTETAQVTATSTVNGSVTNVTSSASWRSSNPLVATVAGGLITAVGPGTAMVTVENGDLSQTATVTVRRRVHIAGEVSVEDRRRGPGGVAGTLVYVDSQQIGDHFPSSPERILETPFGDGVYRRILEPGQHTFLVRISTRPGDGLNSYAFDIEFEGPVKVLDLDTGEQVGTISLEDRQGTFGEDPDVTWTFTAGVYTS